MQGNLEEIFIRCYCGVSVNLSMCIDSIFDAEKNALPRDFGCNLEWFYV